MFRYLDEYVTSMVTVGIGLLLCIPVVIIFILDVWEMVRKKGCRSIRRRLVALTVVMYVLVIPGGAALGGVLSDLAGLPRIWDSVAAGIVIVCFVLIYLKRRALIRRMTTAPD